MIVSIDESGDFQADSPRMHCFVACHIRRMPVSGETKEQQYLRWEEALPASCREQSGEVKGYLLQDPQCASFVEDVLWSEPRVRVGMVGIVPAETPPEILESHRHESLATCNDTMFQYQLAGNKKAANHFKSIGDWYRGLSDPQYLKLLVGTECVAWSMRDAVGHAIQGGYDDELVHWEYKLDRDFVKPGIPMRAWRNALVDAARNVHRGKNTIPILETWTDDQPFLGRFGGRKNFNLEPLFRDRVFYSSASNWEVRVADVVALIARRFHNREGAKKAFEGMYRVFTGRGEIHIMKLVSRDHMTRSAE